MEQILSQFDFSFKYILLGFNLITIIFLYLHKRGQKIQRKHHILFTIAHPDDQCMFFRPTIRSLTRDYFVHILVMTCKGTDRQNQLKTVCSMLEIHKVHFAQNQNIKDGMNQKWNLEQVRNIIVQYIKQNSIKAVFTFDEYGVSDHINHKSIYTALSQLEKQPIKQKKQKQQNPQAKSPSLPQGFIKIYYLQSVMKLRKFSGLAELPIAILQKFSWINLNLIDGYSLMSQHKSQFVWYRKLWVLFSRYTYINTFRQKIICISKQKEQ